MGILRGRPLLDLLLKAGRLSLREPSTLETYWIHPLVLDEADILLDGFFEKAEFHSYTSILAEFYDTKGKPKPWEPPPEDSSELEDLICSQLDDGIPGDWIVEALLSRAPEAYKKLAPIGSRVVAVNGLYLYYRKYLDVAFFTREGYATIVEIKRNRGISELEKGMDQVFYYSYAVSRGFKLSPKKVFPIVAIYDRTGQDLQVDPVRVGLTVKDLAERYGLLHGRASVIGVIPRCTNSGPDAEILPLY